MILNILICVFLGGMLVLWSTYGFFSSFLNLLVTLASALLAFALWEPVSHWLLGMGWVSGWGFGLLLPFALFFILLRLGMLAIARKNLGFHPVVDQVGGAAMGVASGVITAGMLVIGAGLMASDKGLLGVQRFRLSEDGSLGADKTGSSLWIPVDGITGGLVERLSAGSFCPSGEGWTLAAARPKLAEGVEKRRLAVDVLATRTAAPGDGVQVTAAYAMECTPDALEWVLHRSAAYAVMKKDAVDEIWKGQDLKQIDMRLADRVADENAKGDVEKTLFDGKYLGNADRKGVRGLLGRSVSELPESVLRRMWSYADDQIPGGQGADKATPSMDLCMKLVPGMKLLVVDTAWDKEKSLAYDDGILRLSPHQVELLAPASKVPADARSLRPVAWSTGMLATPSGYARRELVEVRSYPEKDRQNKTGIGIYGALSQPGVPDRLAFIFVIPKDVDPEAIVLRGLRFSLKGKIKPAGPDLPAGMELAQVIGHLLPPGNPEEKPTDLTGGKAPVAAAPVEIKAPLGTLEITDRTPLTLDWTSPDEQHSKYEQGQRDAALISGEFDRMSGSNLGQTKYRIIHLKVEPGVRCVRLLLDRAQCQTLWGMMLDSNERGGEELIMRTEGRQIGAAGFIMTRAGSLSVVRINPNGKFKVTGKVLADLRPPMGEDDRLYVYYFVDESETLQGYGLYDPAGKKLDDKQQYELATPVPMK